jgi:hypothetical protein
MELTLESERIGAADDVVTQFLWRSIRAKVLARMGRQGEAMRLSSEAVAIIGLAQDPDSQGYAAIDQAEVLRMVGRTDDAAREAGRAVQLFALKGNTASGSRAQATLGEIEGERAVRSIHR